MQFRIEAAPKGGLRVISRVPDGELVQIDGRNGIGKTLAIRLLQLVTTSQPFADKPQSWTTLKDNLKPVTIWAEGLRGGKTLRFELDPDEWPPEPSSPGDWLGSVYLNDEQVPWSAVPPLLQVRRIGGDETLGESLAAQVATDAELIRQVTRQQEPSRRNWNERIGALRLLTEIPAAFDFARLRSVIAKSEEEVVDVARRLETAQVRADKMAEAERLHDRRNAVIAKRPVLTKRIADLTSSEEAIRAAAQELDERAAEVLTKSQQTDEVWSNVNRLTALQRKRRDRRERRRRDVAELSRAAGVSVPVDLTAAQAEVELLRARRADLEQERQTVDRAGLVLELLDALDGPIDRGMSARLAEEVVAQLPAGPLSLDELDHGLTVRRQVLDQIERSAGDEITGAVAEIDRQLAACADLPDAVRLLTRAETDLQETEDQLAEFLRTLADGVAGDYETVNKQRVERLDELTALVEERAQAEAERSELLAEGDEGDLARLVQEQIAGLGTRAQPTDADGWAVFRSGVLRELMAATGSLRNVTESRDRVRTEFVQAESAVRGATAELSKNPRHVWLKAEGLPMPQASASIEAQLDALRALGKGASRVDDLLLRTLNEQQSLERALFGLETRLRASGTAGQLQAGQRGEFSARVELHYQRRFADELSTDMVRAALFSNGSGISVDLRTMSTSWTLPSGQRNTRPLEAFSSGERAFAYTRVQVERLTSDRAENRVIFLDEFGSFVAQDRFEELKRFLKSQALGRAADKIVLILPLRRTPTESEQQELVQRGGYVASVIS
ncbi:hypothetical protein [uncultured Friedmanniella sp.]|uniref:hypothetical protein n=1 Tax=uncultured Friedmanniella sp. TaxID=335381 RepID=UPI0035CBE500